GSCVQGWRWSMADRCRRSRRYRRAGDEPPRLPSGRRPSSSNRCRLGGKARVIIAHVGGVEHVSLHPGSETFAVVGNRIPVAVEVVVAGVVAVRVRGVGAAGGECDGVDDPGWEHDSAGARPELVDDLLDGYDRASGREDSLLLNADDAP